MRSIRKCTATAALLFAFSSQASAACINDGVPGGYVFPTADPKVVNIYVYDPNNWNAHEILVRRFAGRTSADYRFHTNINGFRMLWGTYQFWALNVDSCGGVNGTPRLLKVISIAQ